MGAHTITIDNGSLAIDLATEFGPRVLGLTPAGGENLFVELPERGIDLGDGRRFSFRGGHRLWLAPELPKVTYEPDDDPVVTGSSRNSAFAKGVVGGIEKSIGVELADDSAVATITHVAVNQGDRPLETALWAISQFRTGGTALLALGDVQADDHGYQPSTRVVGWRYTDWGALEAGPPGVICIPGTRTTPSKIGTALTRGWLAYLVDGWLFAKYADAAPSPLDLGATGQIYVDADFLELETLGMPVILETGEAAEHREVWRVWPAPDSMEEAVEVIEAWRP